MANHVIKREEIPEYIGMERGPSAWLVMSQQRINEFADTTEDHQFIHVDEEAAKNTPFGGTIAHGFLTLSMLSRMIEEFGVAIEGMKMGVNYGLDKVRFLSAVPSGASIRGRAKIKDITEKNKNQFLITYEVTVEIKDQERPALIAEWLALVVVE